MPNRSIFARFLSFCLIILLLAGPVWAGITVTGADGITVTGADGISYLRTSGITVTGADGFLGFTPNGITANTLNGITVTGADGITVTGADGSTYVSPNSITETNPSGITVTGADGITVTGADGITVTGADGTKYSADSVTIRQPSGITIPSASGITVTGADGLNRQTSNGITVTGADGTLVNGADGITVTGADGITVTGADGQVFNISPNGVTVTGADGIVMTRVNGVTVTGADALSAVGTTADQLSAATAGIQQQSGLQSLDPELAVWLYRATDDSNINAIITYYQSPTDSDIADLQAAGVVGGTRYRALPVVAISATRSQIIAISHFPRVRSIYGNRTLQSNSVSGMTASGGDRVRTNADLTRANAGLPLSGRGVTVAVLDTGLDGTHGDLTGRVTQNVKLADTQSISAGFTYPVNIENVPNTDQAYGHGTFVAGVIAGNGMDGGGKYAGVAPGAHLVGLSAGDLTLSFVLSGFDYLLANNAALNVRVINCSFSANTAFDINDPVNIATKMLVDRGVNVVFSSGNNGPGLHTLNPYAVAPWVISVGATDESGKLADFSARGDFASPLFHPTVVAPGVNIVSLRSSTIASVTGGQGLLLGADTSRLSPSELPYYTTSSGTSFSAPQVAGTIALMLEANPRLTPAQVRDILERTATPLPPYYAYEVGAGKLNAYAAVLQAAFSQRRFGIFRATMDRGQARFLSDPPQEFTGSTAPGTPFTATLSVPDSALLASCQVGWGLTMNPSNPSLALFDPSGVDRGDSNTSPQPGLFGTRERVAVKYPASGQWQAVLGAPPAGAALPFSGVLEVTRVRYAPLRDMAALDPSVRDDINWSLRNFVMAPLGQNFRPAYGVSRAALANALLAAGRVPQYFPAAVNYTDLSGAAQILAVESAQAAPCGALFPDAAKGGAFRPDDAVDRLTAAVALVRAAGFRSEAEASSGATLNIQDADSIPSNLRGYVASALAHGLMTAANGTFRPQSALSRAELAHAVSAIGRLNS